MNQCSDKFSVSEDNSIAKMNDRHQFMMSRLAHEVRNPLTLIYSSLQIIEKEYPDVADSFLWPQVMADVQDTIRLLKDLSAPPDSEPCRKEDIHLSSMLEHLSCSCRSFMETRGVTFTCVIDPELPSIYGSELRLKQAILNLLLNACDAASAASGKGTVRLSAAQESDHIVIHVRDNGPGIPAKYRDEIFHPYVTHKAAGTGVGLSVVKDVAASFQGTLLLDTDMDSEETYTDFCLRIPVRSSVTD